MLCLDVVTPSVIVSAVCCKQILGCETCIDGLEDKNFLRLLCEFLNCVQHF